MTNSSEDLNPRIIVALDFPSPGAALDLATALNPEACRLKVGKELFVRGGSSLVKRLVNAGFDVFLDLKFHDIPHTVANACQAAAEMGVWMMTVHALGGREMMTVARQAVENTIGRRPLVVAVTLLTSLDTTDLREIGIGGTSTDSAKRLATLAHQAGLDGVVCAAQEAGVLRHSFGPGFRLVTPGIRPLGHLADDQKRITTPYDAISHGADFLVVGRPITAADDPVEALLALQAEVDAAIAVGSR